MAERFKMRMEVKTFFNWQKTDILNGTEEK